VPYSSTARLSLLRRARAVANSNRKVRLAITHVAEKSTASGAFFTDIMPSEPPEQRAHYNIRPVTVQESPRRLRSVPSENPNRSLSKEGRTHGAALWRTFRVLRRGWVRQNGRVPIAISSIQSIRRRLKLEPLQQRFVLRMVRNAVRHDHWEGRVGESFNHVSGFAVILAVSVRGAPPRGQIVDPVTDHKWIVIGLGDFSSPHYQDMGAFSGVLRIGEGDGHSAMRGIVPRLREKLRYLTLTSLPKIMPDAARGRPTPERAISGASGKAYRSQNL
jgi:hypothetical protein